MITETVAWPAKTREVRNAYQDSTRWNGFEFRDGDVVVSTWAKTGTTWTQQIVWQLLNGAPKGTFETAQCPWVDMRPPDFAEMIATVKAQTGRRCLKTHLPIDALVYSPMAKYIFVGRDARDVTWSAYNHQAGYTDAAMAMLNETPGRVGPPAARPTGDVRHYYLDFLEHDEWPGFGGNPFWAHTQGWWDARHLPNLLLVHFANLKADLAGQVRRIADFIGVTLSEETLPAILAHCDIAYMREGAATGRMATTWKDGAATFFNRGTNGRWRDVLSPAEIARCDEVAARRLTADCARWLKTGRPPD